MKPTCCAYCGLDLKKAKMVVIDPQWIADEIRLRTKWKPKAPHLDHHMWLGYKYNFHQACHAALLMKNESRLMAEKAIGRILG